MMEPESQHRRRRRSIRNLRRSSCFYTDSLTPELEVDDPKTDSHDDNLVSAYGSIWLEGDNLGKDTESMVTCVSDKSRHTVGNDNNACDLHCDKQAVLPSPHSSCEFSEGSFLNNHQSFNGGSLGIQHVSSGLGSDSIDVTSLSLYDSGIASTLPLQSPKQPMVRLGVDVKCGDEPCPRITLVPSTHVSYSLRKSASADDVSLEQENMSLSLDANICVFKNKRLHENICHGETILKENKQYSNEVVKTVLTDEVIRNVLAEKLPDSENVSEPSDDPSTASLKERRKSDQLNEGPDMVKDTECKPKKRKRLSLKKIPADSAKVKPDHVDRHGETNGDMKINIAAESDDNINDSFDKMINTHFINTYNINSTNDTAWIDPSKWSENLELISYVDHGISKDVDFETEFFFQDFQVSAYEKKSKRSSKSKAKAARRSSRLFNPCEMPLNDLSLDENPTFELSSSQTSENELYSSETNSCVSVINSPKFSGVMNRLRENKENIPTMDVCTTGKMQKLEEAHSTNYVQSVGTDNLSVKDSALVEGVMEDFANLCMNEKTVAHRDRSIQDLGSARWRGGDSTVLSDTNNITVANVYSCASTDGDKGDVSDMSPHDDAVSTCNNLLDSSTLQENVSSNREISFHSEKCIGAHEEQNDNMEDQHSPFDTAFSTPSADVDMEELLSPDKKPAEHETAGVISESGKCMKLRRGRKSWDTNQQLKPDARKKPARIKSQQGRTEKQANKLVNVNNADTSVAVPVTEQSDNDGENIDLSPGLVSLYLNKNFVAPQPKSWETIKESPKSSQFLFTKQRHKCFLEFETGITRAKLQRRHKKALDIYKKMERLPSAISDKEFEQTMLDIQLSIDS